MTEIAKLELFIRTQDYEFQRKDGKEKSLVSDLFCTHCGGFKPHCRCNSFDFQMELMKRA